MSFLEEIVSPPKPFSPYAFWFWYGELKPERMRRQIDEMTDKGVYNGFMHSRAYLKTPYLEQGWWDAVSACVEEGERVGFYPWLYDEYAWPSGTAGSTFDYGFQKPSRVLAKGECNMAKSLAIQRYADVSAFSEAARRQPPEFAFLMGENGWRQLGAGEEPAGPGEILAFTLKVHAHNVDYLNRDTIRLFMDYTHEAYKARYGKYFGRRIPGIFFDEIYMQAQALPWTGRLAGEFEKRRGYALIPQLPALAVEGGEKERQVRRDYYQTIAELYEEAFFLQISEWCEENHLQLTGHTEESLAGHPGRQGNYFNTMRHLHIPGADNHDYRYRFPRKITYCEPKYAVSVARTYGKTRAMSEAMGGAGWGCSLQQFKRGINTMGAMGINMFTLHGFYSECDMQGSQSDWPTSFFEQNPYWRYFGQFASYINRVCYMNAIGRPVVDIGLYYPIEQMQEQTVAGRPTEAGAALNRAFHTVLDTLLENQMDVDMVDSARILMADVSHGSIRVGAEDFKVLLCPEYMQPSGQLGEKLREFEKNGGILLRYACGKQAAEGCIAPESLYEALAERIQPDAQVIRGSRDNLFISHRSIEGRECYFVSNSSPAARFVTLLLREKGGILKLSPEDGGQSPVTCRMIESGTEADLFLKEDEGCWLVVDSALSCANPLPPRTAEEKVVSGKWSFLPIARSLTGGSQLDCMRSRLQIPLARLSALQLSRTSLIRICNKEGEAGRCSRHLSLWKAAWICRRPAWQDDCNRADLFFRKTFTLSNLPDSARACIAAVNEWSLWVNGEWAASSREGLEPAEVDISGLIRQGENLIAVSVHNDRPLMDHNVCSAETLPADRFTSLLFEAAVSDGERSLTIASDESWAVSDRAEKGWKTAAFCPQVKHIEASACRSFGDGANPGEWIDAWERGCPPLLPWGDLPLFGEKISYPQQLVYQLTLPAGTARVFRPQVAGEDIAITIDGITPVWEERCFSLKPDGLTHQMEIRVTALSGQDGLQSWVEVEAVPFRSALYDWRLHGLSWYSGFARYENTVRIQKQPGRYLLDLGQVAFQAEVFVNGRSAGARVWAPYRLDITDLLHDGENAIAVVASNSEAVERQFMLVDEGMSLGWNRYWNDDNIQREGENLVSGLLGPVQILHQI